MKSTIVDKKTDKILIENDTRDYAEDGKHFWNLAIKTDLFTEHNKENIYTISELEVKDANTERFYG